MNVLVNVTVFKNWGVLHGYDRVVLDLHLNNWGVLHGYDRVVAGFTS